MHGRVLSRALAGCAALFVTTAAPRDARACGGCFQPPQEVTVVTGHRMAFAISTQQTVLWDQIQYSGAPEEFAWVLPVRGGARIELSHDEWFAALDASTRPVITGPPPPSSGGGIGCGSSEDSAIAPGGGSVQVLAQEVVGPYEAVTLRSSDANALEAWLAMHGFDLPASVQPTVDAYVGEGFDFIALRLRPGQGVQAMQPVRVITPGADPTLPLRMVAAGVGANVGILLFVIGEGRWEPDNFPSAVVDDTPLVWDANANRSNYDEVATGVMAREGGRMWITEYSRPPDLTVHDVPVFGQPNPGLADAYFSQCAKRDAAPPAPICDAGGDDASDADASAALCAPPRGPADCPAFDDLEVATAGLHASDVWVTRLRSNLPKDALSPADLRLRASSPQTQVTNLHQARGAADDSGCATARRRSPPFGWTLLFAASALAMGRLLRRRC